LQSVIGFPFCFSAQKGKKRRKNLPPGNGNLYFVRKSNLNFEGFGIEEKLVVVTFAVLISGWESK
jgi:hypothetical protein